MPAIALLPLGETATFAEQNPVGRAVTGTGEAPRINESLGQQQLMAMDRLPAEQGQPPAAAFGHVAQRLAHHPVEAEVMVPAHQFFPALALAGANGPDDGLSQAAGRWLGRKSPMQNGNHSITTTYPPLCHSPV
jgi:hypothetical protein